MRCSSSASRTRRISCAPCAGRTRAKPTRPHGPRCCSCWSTAGGPDAIASIRRHGAAYLLSRAITRAEVVAFADLGMEAIHAFELKEFPVTVAVDATGASVHSHLQLKVAGP